MVSLLRPASSQIFQVPPALSNRHLKHKPSLPRAPQYRSSSFRLPIRHLLPRSTRALQSFRDDVPGTNDTMTMRSGYNGREKSSSVSALAATWKLKTSSTRSASMSSPPLFPHSCCLPSALQLARTSNSVKGIALGTAVCERIKYLLDVFLIECGDLVLAEESEVGLLFPVLVCPLFKILRLTLIPADLLYTYCLSTSSLHDSRSSA